MRHIGRSSDPGTALHSTFGDLRPLPQEDQDAEITGSTRSLTRRLMALNLRPSVRHHLPLAAIADYCTPLWAPRKSA